MSTTTTDPPLMSPASRARLRKRLLAQTPETDGIEGIDLVFAEIKRIKDRKRIDALLLRDDARPAVYLYLEDGSNR